MGLFDDDREPVPPTGRHELGQDISALSIAELRQRIGDLAAEIERLEREIEAKGATKSAAEAFFRRD